MNWRAFVYSCRYVFNRELDVPGQWVQSWRSPEPWEPPTWATSVREIACRDGRVFVMRGTPPEAEV